MRYYKDSKGSFFGIDVGQDKLIKSDWILVSKAEVDKSNAPTPEQLKLNKIAELQKKLKDTDYKDLPSYDKRGTSEWTKAMKQRQAWRDEIRKLENA